MILLDFLNFLFNPVLWSLPFLVLILINIYELLKHGVYFAKLPFYKPFNSINVISFCILWLLSVFSLSKKFDNLTTIYLAFAVIFACYGTGELFYRIVWTPIRLKERDFFIWTTTFIYPIFFALNNVALLVFLREEFQTCWKQFMFFILGMFILYCVFYIFQTLWKRTPSFPKKSFKWYAGQTAYYFARIFSIIAYFVLLFQKV